jgi:hypothetical protein
MPQQMPMVYPVPTSNDIDEDTVEPIMPYQQAEEYNGQAPEKQAPQE